MQRYFYTFKSKNIINHQNVIKDSNNTNITIDAEKKLLQNSNVFTIKSLERTALEEIFLTIIYALYDKPTDNTVLNVEHF